MIAIATIENDADINPRPAAKKGVTRKVRPEAKAAKARPLVICDGSTR
jgi:hypothetical protein